MAGGGVMIRTLIANLMGWKIVWLKDFDGHLYRRLARPTRKGLIAKRFGLGIANVLLLPDGKLIGPSYVESWWEE